MIRSTTTFAASLSALAITCAMATIYAQPAAAQTFGRTIFVRSNGVTPAANCNKLRNALAPYGRPVHLILFSLHCQLRHQQ